MCNACVFRMVVALCHDAVLQDGPAIIRVRIIDAPVRP